MQIAEVFGYGVENQTDNAWTNRRNKLCPFRGTLCTKSSKTDPIGICSLSDGKEAASLCPFRFTQKNQIFKDAARIAFGEGVRFGVFPEIRILKIESVTDEGRDKKIGKVDYVIGRVDGQNIADFAAIEVQAVYFSGTEIRSPMNYYLTHRALDNANSDRRPDFRSSAQKRLVPQLQLKVPVFRRWGKRFFVVVDSQFFRALPAFRDTSSANSELTWLRYPIEKKGADYRLGDVQVCHSEWDEVRNALREGVPPDPTEIKQELEVKLRNRRKPPLLLEI